MCMNCGCGMPDDKHGNDANITASDLRRAGEANGQSMGDTVTHIQQAAAQMGGTGSAAGSGTMGSSSGGPSGMGSSGGSSRSRS